MAERWDSEEVAWLVEHAGKMPKAELCRKLGRSPKAVEAMVSRLNRKGLGLSLRHFAPRTHICPACGKRRATLGTYGICEPCRRADQLAAIEDRSAELLAQLPPERRVRYDRYDKGRGSRVDPRPTVRSPGELGDMELERWEVEQIRRRIKAAQRRMERLQKCVRSMKKENS